jgi:Zn-dependent peptidase ImmA (M78 family)
VNRRHGIPKKFRLATHSVTVKLVPKSRWKHGRCIGLWNPQKLQIDVLSSQPASMQKHTFVHELLHACCDAGGETLQRLSRDEAAIDELALLLTHCLETFDEG